MSIFSIKFQTADSIPPPFAHAIEVKGKFVQNQEIEISFEQIYLGRELISLDEIEEEGFTEHDDFIIESTLPKVWSDFVFGNLKSSKPLKIKELNEFQDFWEIDFEGKNFYPENHENWKYILEELQQALFEKKEVEKPLKLSFLKISFNENSTLLIHGSFANRSLEVISEDNLHNRQNKKILNWSELNFILKNTFAGDFNSENASNKIPSSEGIYINIGDEFWYEFGKSWLISPNKIKNIFKFYQF